MSADDFTEAANAAAREYARAPRMNVGTAQDRIGQAHADGWEAARTHLAAQEPTDAEVGAVQKRLHERTLTWVPTVEVRAALNAARAARRDEEN